MTVQYRSPRHAVLLDVWYVIGPLFVASPIAFSLYLLRFFKKKTGKNVTHPKEGEELGEAMSMLDEPAMVKMFGFFYRCVRRSPAPQPHSLSSNRSLVVPHCSLPRRPGCHYSH